ncbi:MAG: DUF456 domain-containing protein [Anaerolineales bacterium]|nr:DUF456 domain-containing protein [Anaerolineales bacterium]
MPEVFSALFTELARLLIFAAMLVGLFGMIVPIFPGGFVIWLAALIYGLLEGFSGAGWAFFLLISLLAIAGMLVDNVLMARAARKQGASWWSLTFAFVGGVVGTILLPPFGGLLGAPLLLYLSEMRRRRSTSQAWEVTRGLLVGWGWSFVARFVLGLAKIGLWLGWVLWVDGVLS